jgi:pyruvate,water dikinase
MGDKTAVSALVPDKAGSGGGVSLKGVPASEGISTGRARVISSAAELALVEAGEVIVTQFTNSSFNLVIGMAAGVVTELGGTLSHAAITCREVRIPCVTNCANALQRIPQGAEIEVNGSSGEVRVLMLPSRL